MKILHSALTKEPIPGILNQMNYEQLAADALQLNVDCLLCVSHESSKINSTEFNIIKNLKAKTWFLSRLKYYYHLHSIIDTYDFILLRHSIADPFEYIFLIKHYKKIFLVHHTLELVEMKSRNSVKSKLKYWIELIFGNLSIKKAHGLVAVTNEIFDYENRRANFNFSNRIIYPNGIMFDNAKLTDLRSDCVPEIVFIASDFPPWHGLDLLLADLESHIDQNFILHIIGKTTSKQRSLASHDSRINFHGVLGNEDIESILEKAWVGLSSFGLDRKNMKEACTLKVREYLRYGVPVYSGHRDVFPNNFKFYTQGKPKFKDILGYAFDMRQYSKEDVQKCSETYISKEKLLKELWDNIDNIKDNTI